ncbi:hypothetical protein C8C82_0450 [Flavobacterium sp. 81]|nr:hypothetical protein C8C82_0450 [Flavobacterium sp. 81]
MHIKRNPDSYREQSFVLIKFFFWIVHNFTAKFSKVFLLRIIHIKRNPDSYREQSFVLMKVLVWLVCLNRKVREGFFYEGLCILIAKFAKLCIDKALRTLRLLSANQNKNLCALCGKKDVSR